MKSKERISEDGPNSVSNRDTFGCSVKAGPRSTGDEVSECNAKDGRECPAVAIIILLRKKNWIMELSMFYQVVGLVLGDPLSCASRWRE